MVLSKSSTDWMRPTYTDVSHLLSQQTDSSVRLTRNTLIDPSSTMSRHCGLVSLIYTMNLPQFLVPCGSNLSSSQPQASLLFSIPTDTPCSPHHSVLALLSLCFYFPLGVHNTMGLICFQEHNVWPLSLHLFAWEDPSLHHPAPRNKPICSDNSYLGSRQVDGPRTTPLMLFVFHTFPLGF